MSTIIACEEPNCGFNLRGQCTAMAIAFRKTEYDDGTEGFHCGMEHERPEGEDKKSRSTLGAPIGGSRLSESPPRNR